jgi:hypothetical protein
MTAGRRIASGSQGWRREIVPPLSRQVRDRRPLVGGLLIRVLVLTAGHVDHQLDQMVLGRHIAIQRHRGDAELGRHPAHGHRVQSPGVGQPDGRGRGRRAVVLALRPARALLRDIQLEIGVSLVSPFCPWSR